MHLLFKLRQTPDLIFDYLTDMQKFVSVHPVISKINKTGYESYLVYETLKLGIIPFSFSYPVTIEKNIAGNFVIIRAQVMRLVKIEMKFVLIPNDDYTIVEENIQFKSYLPIKFIMQRVFKKQHNQLFKNIAMKEV